jgi:hypothetical protein
LKDTNYSTDVGITADTAVPNMALCHRQNVPAPRNGTASPFHSVVSEQTVSIDIKVFFAPAIQRNITDYERRDVLPTCWIWKSTLGRLRQRLFFFRCFWI